ncbi:globin family protein [Halobacteriovorax sp. GB3]|uniref:globin family protein n=1 Tax=Halobacteriovorax sp. GB3 TaxID=2719615 RepID=UPI002361BA8C|nr:globin family protein [Halobacteriovorax sp. GB3]MDD0853905.1 globin family protein [Halobacteriovorax sp. GB3]
MSINIQMIRESFDVARPIGMEVVSKFYEFLFQDYPQARPLFENVNMEAQKKQLLGALVLAVDNLDNPEKLRDYLLKSGKRHVGYGVEEDHYPLVGQTLLKTFAHFFQDKWTNELQNEWIKVYEFIANTMIEGASQKEEGADVLEITHGHIRSKAKDICHQILMESIDDQIDDTIRDVMRAKVRKVILEVLEEESTSILKKAA